MCYVPLMNVPKLCVGAAVLFFVCLGVFVCLFWGGFFVCLFCFLKYNDSKYLSDRLRTIRKKDLRFRSGHI